MSKKPTLRPSYQSDAKYFRRLAHAVEHDVAKPKWWRELVIAKVMELTQLFEGADNVQETEEAEAQEA